MGWSCSEGDAGDSGLVEGAVAEHGEQDADALAGKAEESLGVGFTAGALAVVVGAGGRVGEGGERGEEEGPLELFVAAAGGLLAADGGAGAAGGRCEAGVGGEVGGGRETWCSPLPTSRPRKAPMSLVSITCTLRSYGPGLTCGTSCRHPHYEEPPCLPKELVVMPLISGLPVPPGAVTPPPRS